MYLLALGPFRFVSSGRFVGNSVSKFLFVSFGVSKLTSYVTRRGWLVGPSTGWNFGPSWCLAGASKYVCLVTVRVSKTVS